MPEINSIHIQNLSYQIGGNSILNNISFDIKQGSYIALIGPNGAGKTTLIKLLLGIISPTHGTITFGETDIHHVKNKFIFGYIPQRISATYTKFPATVYEVVQSGRTARIGLFKRFSKDDLHKIDEVLAMTEIEKYKNSPISQLSGGQLQRVFIARALAGEPKVLLLDEPTVGVDMKSQEQFYQFLHHLNHVLQITVLIVTHEVDVAVHRAKEVLCLNQSLLCHVSSGEFLAGSYLEQLYGKHTHLVAHTHYGDK